MEPIFQQYKQCLPDEMKLGMKQVINLTVQPQSKSARGSNQRNRSQGGKRPTAQYFDEVASIN